MPGYTGSSCFGALKNNDSANAFCCWPVQATALPQCHSATTACSPPTHPIHHLSPLSYSVNHTRAALLAHHLSSRLTNLAIGLAFSGHVSLVSRPSLCTAAASQGTFSVVIRATSPIC